MFCYTWKSVFGTDVHALRHVVCDCEHQRDTNITFRISVSIIHKSSNHTTYIFTRRECLALVLEWPQPDQSKSQNLVKLSFTPIKGACSSYVGCQSFLQLYSPDILAFCDANSID